MDVLQEFMASEIPKASSKGRTGRKHRRGSRNSRVSGVRQLAADRRLDVVVVLGLWHLCVLHACRICHAGSWHLSLAKCAGYLNQESDHSVHGDFGMVLLGLVAGIWR